MPMLLLLSIDSLMLIPIHMKTKHTKNVYYYFDQSTWLHTFVVFSHSLFGPCEINMNVVVNSQSVVVVCLLACMRKQNKSVNNELDVWVYVEQNMYDSARCLNQQQHQQRQQQQTAHEMNIKRYIRHVNFLRIHLRTAE